MPAEPHSRNAQHMACRAFAVLAAASPALAGLPEAGAQAAAQEAGVSSPAPGIAFEGPPAPSGAKTGERARLDDEPFPEVRAYINRVIREDGIASVAVSVVRNGEFLWEEGFGWADRERRIRATEHTPYSTASISKPVTATALAVLAEEGVLDLEDPANDHLAEAGRLRSYEGDPDEATLERILAHTAGLPLHYHFFYEGSGEAPPSRDETIRRYGAVVHPPGERYVYSNLGYGVLDRVVERAAGAPFAEVVQREVLAPLGMHRSAVGLRRGLGEHAAARYGQGEERLPFYRFDHDGASAVYASAHDLARFGLFHLGIPLEDQRAILGEDLRAAMQEDRTPDGSPRGYGLGWIVDDDHHGHRQVAHSGGMPGVSTQLQLYPDEDVVVAVVTNSMPRRAGAVADSIARRVLPDWEEERAEGAQAEGDGGPGDDDTFQPPAELRGAWDGVVRTYDGSVPFWMEVREDGDVHVRLDDQLETVLNDPEFEDGVLRGEFQGRLPTPDAERQPHTVLLEVAPEGDRLRGSATARSTTRPIHFALSARVEAERDEEG